MGVASRCRQGIKLGAGYTELSGYPSTATEQPVRHTQWSEQRSVPRLCLLCEGEKGSEYR